MASRKKRKQITDYADAMDRVARLRAKGDSDSDEYLAAIEAATRFFLRDNRCRYFNPELELRESSGQELHGPKWPTIKELCETSGIENTLNSTDRDVFVERQKMSTEAEFDELDR